jgi:hypothetical protein
VRKEASEPTEAPENRAHGVPSGHPDLTEKLENKAHQGYPDNQDLEERRESMATWDPQVSWVPQDCQVLRDHKGKPE